MLLSETMYAVRAVVRDLRASSAALVQHLCYFREAVEVDLRPELYSEHVTQSPHLERKLCEGAAAVEEAAEKLRVPCFLKNDPEDVSTRNCTANLALAEELAGHQAALAVLLTSLKLDLIEAVDEQNLFRCVSCSTLFSGPLDKLEAMQIPCPVVEDGKEGVHCNIIQCVFHDVFRKVANLWAKKLRIERSQKSIPVGINRKT